jgi:YOP proteins translocation protein K (YscK)
MRVDEITVALAAFNHIPSLYVHPSRTLFAGSVTPKLLLSARSHAELSRDLLREHHVETDHVDSWPDHPLAQLSQDDLRSALSDTAGMLFAAYLRHMVSAKDVATLKLYLGDRGYTAALRFARQANDFSHWSTQTLRENHGAYEWASAWWLLQLEATSLAKGATARLALRLPRSAHDLAAKLKSLVGSSKSRDVPTELSNSSNFAQQIVLDMYNIH